MEIKKGVYIRKKNWKMFSDGMPFLKVMSVEKKSRGYIFINGTLSFEEEHITIINEKERSKALEVYNNISIRDTVEEYGLCFTGTADKRPKEKYERKRLKRTMFEMIMRSGENNILGYKCKTCGYYHIGKSIRLRLSLNDRVKSSWLCLKAALYILSNNHDNAKKMINMLYKWKYKSRGVKK